MIFTKLYATVNTYIQQLGEGQILKSKGREIRYSVFDAVFQT